MDAGSRIESADNMKKIVTLSNVMLNVGISISISVLHIILCFIVYDRMAFSIILLSIIMIGVIIVSFDDIGKAKSLVPFFIWCFWILQSFLYEEFYFNSTKTSWTVIHIIVSVITCVPSIVISETDLVQTMKRGVALRIWTFFLFVAFTIPFINANALSGIVMSVSRVVMLVIMFAIDAGLRHKDDISTSAAWKDDRVISAVRISYILYGYIFVVIPLFAVHIGHVVLTTSKANDILPSRKMLMDIIITSTTSENKDIVKDEPIKRSDSSDEGEIDLNKAASKRHLKREKKEKKERKEKKEKKIKREAKYRSKSPDRISDDDNTHTDLTHQHIGHSSNNTNQFRNVDVQQDYNSAYNIRYVHTILH